MNTAQRSFVEEFQAAHGAYEVDPDNSAHNIFQDGAFLEMTSFGPGVSHEPPTDDFERAKLIAKYHHIRLQRAIKQFDRFKEECATDATQCAIHRNLALLPDKSETFTKLKRLRGIVAKLNKAYVKAQAVVDEHKPFWVTEREAEGARARQAADDFLGMINNITI